MNSRINLCHTKSEMLLVLPVPFRRLGADLLIERQAHHGIRRWLDDFESLTIAAPVMPDELAERRPDISWVRSDDLPRAVQLVALPWAYRIDHFFLEYFRTRVLLSQLIDDSTHLQFAIGGLWGDWAAVGALVALKKGRRYSVHTDRVEHEVIRRNSQNAPFARRARARAESFLMELLHKRVIFNASLGLFHGMDTYSAYHDKMSSDDPEVRAFCIHNIHDEGMFESGSGAIVKRCTDGVHGRLSIFYAGRFVKDKAPMDWLAVMKKLKEMDVSYSSTWAGDGVMRFEFENRVKTMGLKGAVNVPGFIENRFVLSGYYKSADVFLFTHVTPESPRCLLEALRFGVPIIGYDSEYARDLISANGGGILVSVGDIVSLAEAVCELAVDRRKLQALKIRALKDGQRFTSRAVFAERSHLIKKFA